MSPALNRSRDYRGRTLRRAAPYFVVVFALLATPATAMARHRHAKLHPTHVMRLSNETTYTRYAEAMHQAKIHRRPLFHARVLHRLAFFTPDQEAVQTYVVLRQERIGRHIWVKLRIPMRPNGRKGWVLRRDLGQYWLTHLSVVVDRATTTLTVYRRGTKIFRTRVGVGRPTLPTPPGHFWITESFRSTDAAYGPWAFGTSDYATFQTAFADGSMVGIHGTDMPWLIPGYPSHGCIRLRDASILELKKYIGGGVNGGIGVPVRVQ